MDNTYIFCKPVSFTHTQKNHFLIEFLESTVHLKTDLPEQESLTVLALSQTAYLVLQ